MRELLSVNVGLPRDHPWEGRTVRTGAWKEPVAGARMVRRLGMDGDGQGDTVGHGGPNRAVLVYQIESYGMARAPRTAGHRPGNPRRESHRGRLGDDEVFIGDRYRIGEAEFEVTQPRVTCFRAGLRLGRPGYGRAAGRSPPPRLLHARDAPRATSRPAIRIVKTRDGPGPVSVADIDALLYLPDPIPPRSAGRRRPGAQPRVAGSFPNC